VVVGEPRTTADADAIVFVSQAEAETLIGRASAAGFEAREDMAPWNRLRRLLAPNPPGDA